MRGILKKLLGGGDEAVITVVSGLPRSGTSMMMKMLAAGGIAPLTDEIRTADGDNPKGYYEFERVKAMDKGDTAWLPEARGKAVKVISALLKHLPDDHNYRVIFMRRDMPEILASQKKMLVHRGKEPNEVDDAELAAMFEAHLQAVLRWLEARPNVTTCFVHYREMLTEPERQAERVNGFLGGKLDVAAMAAVVDPALYRNRARSK